jgi:hypothetical protein
VKTEFLILADAAQVANGKLFILGGGWSVYRSAVYPAQVQLALGISILIDWSEAGIRHPVTITMADAAGVLVIPELRGQVEAGKPAELGAGVTQRALLAVNAGLVIPRPGRYVVAAIAGASRAEVSFEAVFVSQKQPGAASPPEPGQGLGN